MESTNSEEKKEVKKKKRQENDNNDNGTNQCMQSTCTCISQLYLSFKTENEYVPLESNIGSETPLGITL